MVVVELIFGYACSTQMAELERKLGLTERVKRITGQMLVRPYRPPEDPVAAKGERYYQARSTHLLL
jgi:hypothetical protein